MGHGCVAQKNGLCAAQTNMDATTHLPSEVGCVNRLDRKDFIMGSMQAMNQQFYFVVSKECGTQGTPTCKPSQQPSNSHSVCVSWPR